MRLVRWLLVGVAAVLVLVGGVGYWLLRQFVGECGLSEFERLSSPAGRRDLVVFQIDCGATTSFNSQVAVTAHGAPVAQAEGRAFFVLDGGNDGDEFYEGGGPKVGLSWLSENQISISYPGAARVFRQESVVDDIKVRYRTH